MAHLREGLESPGCPLPENGVIFPTRSEGVDRFIKELGKSKNLPPPAEVEKEFFWSMRPTSLLQRFASPEEVASMVTYLASLLAAATNGAAVRVDGGVVRSMV